MNKRRQITIELTHQQELLLEFLEGRFYMTTEELILHLIERAGIAAKFNLAEIEKAGFPKETEREMKEESAKFEKLMTPYEKGVLLGE